MTSAAANPDLVTHRPVLVESLIGRQAKGRSCPMEYGTSQASLQATDHSVPGLFATAALEPVPIARYAADRRPASYTENPFLACGRHCGFSMATTIRPCAVACSSQD